MQIKKTLSSTAVVLALMSFNGTPAIAGTITGWNTGNVVTTDTANPDGDFFSYIYDKTTTDGSGTSTNGYVKFTPPESNYPGMVVQNNVKTGVVSNCIMAQSAVDCNGPFQSTKRFKLDRTDFAPIDMVFDVDPNGIFVNPDGTLSDNNYLYKVFQKYGNNTGTSLESFTVELGFGIGADFAASTSGDGLNFFDFGAAPEENQFSSSFAAGLFGTANKKHPLDGYFSKDSAGYNLIFGEDSFQSAGLFGDYDNLFGDLLSYSMTPDGYFYDDDGDPLTDALLMAHYDETTGKWIMNREIDAAGNVVSVSYGNDGTELDDVEAVVAALTANVLLPFCIDAPDVPCLAGVDSIEDLAKFNLTYYLDQIAVTNVDNFTLRITAVGPVAIAAAVPEPGTLALLSLGLLGLIGAKRRLG